MKEGIDVIKYAEKMGIELKEYQKQLLTHICNMESYNIIPNKIPSPKITTLPIEVLCSVLRKNNKINIKRR